MNKAERQHQSRMVEQGCIACRLDGTPGTPAEIHHIRHQGKRDNCHMLVVPLCPAHHRGREGVVSVHGSLQKFKMLYGDELSLLNEALKRLYD